DGENLVADGATLENTTLGENVHVMAGAEVTDSHLDGSVVFPDATLRDCDVRNSIIDEDTHLTGIDFAGALVGAHTHIENGE
ncbi:MAG: NDP-sugar synthase, partial [Halobacteriaceae archaeon]